MNLSTTVALVTGANRGLGRHLAAELHARGTQVWGGARKPAEVELPGVTPVHVDLKDPASIVAAAERASDVTLLINNAGVAFPGNLLTAPMADIREVMEVNYFGTLEVTRAFAPVIARNGGGTIANVLSTVSWLGSRGLGGYAASKSAAWSATNTSRLLLAESGIRLLGVHAYFIATDLTAGVPGPKSDPGDVAKMIADAIEADEYELLVDDQTRAASANLSGGVAALYPQLRVSA